MLRIVAVLLGLIVLVSDPADSETYYVASLGTKIQGTSDGSESRPFLSLQGAFASGKVKGGDTLLLKDGPYGNVTIKANAAFDSPVTIASLNGNGAHFDRILLAQNTRNLTLRNLSVWPRDPASGTNYLVRAYETTSDIVIDGLDIRSEEGAAAYMQWDLARWGARKYSGVLLQGPRGHVINSRLTGIYHGIIVGTESRVVKNTISGFNGDGLRAHSDSLVQGNIVYDCVKTDSNHDDGFQAFRTKNLVVDGNFFFEWTGDPSHPLICNLQGIGLFDGLYENTRITNNVVSVSAYHGISIYGAKGVVVSSNTVVNSRGVTTNRPYIAVRPHKDGTNSKDVLVTNNVAMSFHGTASLQNNIVFLNNSVVGTASLVFENPREFDYRPKASSGFIDTGDTANAPAKDVLGNPRPSGPLPDRGAYEIQSALKTTKPPIVKPEVKPAPEVRPNPLASSAAQSNRLTQAEPPKKTAPSVPSTDTTGSAAKNITLTRKPLPGN